MNKKNDLADKEFGLLVKENRKARKWSQEKLADLAGTSQGSISRIEHGTQNNLQENTKNGILRALGLDRGSEAETMLDYILPRYYLLKTQIDEIRRIVEKSNPPEGTDERRQPYLELKQFLKK